MKTKLKLEQCDSLKALCEKELPTIHQVPPQKFSLMLPSFAAFLYLVIIVFSILLFSMALLAIPVINNFMMDNFRSTANIITLFIGIIPVSVTIAIFGMSNLNQEINPNKYSMLFKESYLLVILSCSLLTIIVYLLCQNIAFLIIMTIFISGLSIKSVYNLIELLVNYSKLEEKHFKEYSLRLCYLLQKTYVNNQLYEIGISLLLSSKDSSIKQFFSYKILDFFDADKYHMIHAQDVGILSDVNLLKLYGLLQNLKKQDPSVEIFINDVWQKKVDKETIIFAIRSNEDNIDFKIFNKQINHTFTVNFTYSRLMDTARYEFIQLSKSFEKAILEHRQDDIQFSIRIYLNLLDTIYSLTTGNIDREAQKNLDLLFLFNQSVSIFLLPFDKLKYNIYPQSFKSIDDVIFKPIWQFHKDVLFLAIRNQDYYFFNMQIQYFQIPFYSAVKDATDPTICKSEAWDFLRRIFRYQINDVINSNPERYKEYVISILQAFQQLFKLAFDANKVGDFNNMLQSCLNLFVDQTHSSGSELDQITKSLFEFRQQVRACILFEYMGYLLYMANSNPKLSERCKSLFGVFMENKKASIWSCFSSLSTIYLKAVNCNSFTPEIQSYWDQWCISPSKLNVTEIKRNESLRKVYLVFLIKLNLSSLRGSTLPEDLKQEKDQLIADLNSIEMWASFLDMTQIQADDLIQKIENSPFFNPQTAS
ncbi:hypothetical protein [Cysteiniphilum marinum]|uniref:hypothetical protein n=1 Tax=Cysteiniphilum marinum TaxID=2774191 RepID=UPI00193BCFD5|nr:hypothetical protein [Cysteiniphilum marinum]